MHSDPQSTILSATGLKRTFNEGGRELHVLRGVDLTVHQGEWLSILGRSGSGKSTLLHLIGGLDRPTSGKVLFNGGTDLFTLRGARLDRYRNAHVGLVFQQYHLMPELNALENVLVGAMLGGGLFTWLGRRAEARRQAIGLLERVGLQDRLTHGPTSFRAGSVSASPLPGP